jgi:hypothetical protein
MHCKNDNKKRVFFSNAMKQQRLKALMSMKIRGVLIFFFLFLFFIFLELSQAANVIYFKSSDLESIPACLSVACEFYGLSLETLTLELQNIRTIAQECKNGCVPSGVISATAFNKTSYKMILDLIRKEFGDLPMLIVDVTPDMTLEAIQYLSGETILLYKEKLNNYNKPCNKYSWPARPFYDQEKDIVQAIARMEKLTKLTGVNYDRVMVFPHGIAPAKTIRLLK